MVDTSGAKSFITFVLATLVMILWFVSALVVWDSVVLWAASGAYAAGYLWWLRRNFD